MQEITEIGNKYGKLKVIEKYGANTKGILWKCKCDCGKIYIALGVALRNGRTTACGCMIGIGTGPKRTVTDLVLRGHFLSYKNSKRAKQLGFELTKNEFEKLCRQKCNYCNSIPQQRRVRYRQIDEYSYDNLSGIDRLDNTKGYILGNCIPCCGKCNMMKGNSTKEEFLEQIKLIYKNKCCGT